MPLAQRGGEIFWNVFIRKYPTVMFGGVWEGLLKKYIAADEAEGTQWWLIAKNGSLIKFKEGIYLEFILEVVLSEKMSRREILFKNEEIVRWSEKSLSQAYWKIMGQCILRKINCATLNNNNYFSKLNKFLNKFMMEEILISSKLQSFKFIESTRFDIFHAVILGFFRLWTLFWEFCFRLGKALGNWDLFGN